MGHALRQVILRTRYEITLPIAIELIGTQNLFELKTENVSMGGIFVAFTEDYLPFSSNSLLEVRLTLGDEPDAPRVNFVAKFVHHQTGIGFGIKIVQIEDLFSDFLADYGNRNPDKQY